jgi:hypothetical protein
MVIQKTLDKFLATKKIGIIFCVEFFFTKWQNFAQKNASINLHQ